MEKVGSIRIELDHDGIRQFLQSGEVGSMLTEAARGLAESAGDGFEVEAPPWQGSDRKVVSVYTATHEAMVAEATDKVLTEAVQSCRV